jgi:hypothetical protein
MDYAPINIRCSSREYDNIFRLEINSELSNDSYTPYIWKTSISGFFAACDTLKIFPLAINLYLSRCTDIELNVLLAEKNFLRVRLYYEGTGDSISCISVYNLSYDGLQDEDYKKLLKLCPKDMIATEILLGPYWHFMGFNKNMCKFRRIELSYDVFTYPGMAVLPEVKSVIGLELYGRDAYPSENTEEIIKRNEQNEVIFILR